MAESLPGIVHLAHFAQFSAGVKKSIDGVGKVVAYGGEY